MVWFKILNFQTGKWGQIHRNLLILLGSSSVQDPESMVMRPICPVLPVVVHVFGGNNPLERADLCEMDASILYKGLLFLYSSLKSWVLLKTLNASLTTMKLSVILN